MGRATCRTRPARDVEHLAELLAGGRLVRERRERLVKAGEPAAVGPDGEDEHLDQRRLPSVERVEGPGSAGEHPAAEAQSFRVVNVGEGASDAGAAEGRLVRGAVRERRSSDAGGVMRRGRARGAAGSLLPVIGLGAVMGPGVLRAPAPFLVVGRVPGIAVLPALVVEAREEVLDRPTDLLGVGQVLAVDR